LKDLIRTIRHNLILVFVIIFYAETAFAGSAVILLYHKFGNPNSPSTNTPIKTFTSEMNYLKIGHYNVVKLSALCDLIKNHVNIPDKTVAISIDDGYKSTVKAIKILQKYKFPATIFLYTNAYHWPAFLNWNQINRIVSDPLFDIGNHTTDHAELDRLSGKQIDRDITAAQNSIKKLTGVRAELFAYPYGYYNINVIKNVKHFGFSCAFSQDVGAVDDRTDPYRIPRIAMTGSSFDMKEFVKKLSIKPLHLSAYFPKEKIAGGDIIRITIARPNYYSTAQIYISEHGWLNTVYDKKSGIAYAKTGSITYFRNRIVVKAFDEASKKYAYFTWMVHKLYTDKHL